MTDTQFLTLLATVWIADHRIGRLASAGPFWRGLESGNCHGEAGGCELSGSARLTA